MTTLRLRFKNYDQYDNPVFAVSKENESEQIAYTMLSKIYKKLDKNFDTFLPVYCDEERGFCSIRFKRFPKNNMVVGDIYQITFTIKKNMKANDDGVKNVYVNCYPTRVKYIKSDVHDLGTDIDMSDLSL